jgi:hypothetical protein
LICLMLILSATDSNSPRGPRRHRLGGRPRLPWLLLASSGHGCMASRGGGDGSGSRAPLAPTDRLPPRSGTPSVNSTRTRKANSAPSSSDAAAGASATAAPSPNAAATSASATAAPSPNAAATPTPSTEAQLTQHASDSGTPVVIVDDNDNDNVPVGGGGKRKCG